jgi:hypothetical protein
MSRSPSTGLTPLISAAPFVDRVHNATAHEHSTDASQSAAAAEWLAAREAELLPVPYFHVVFTLPAAIGAIAYQNKATHISGRYR